MAVFCLTFWAPNCYLKNDWYVTKFEFYFGFSMTFWILEVYDFFGKGKI